MKLLAIQLVFIIANAYLSMAVLYQGTLCGAYDSNINPTILCNGTNPRDSCPVGYTRLPVKDVDAFCSLSNTTEVGYGLPGTICGLDTRIDCGRLSPGEACPTGYKYSSEEGVCYKE